MCEVEVAGYDDGVTQFQLGVAFLIYLSVSGGYETSYQLPWQAIGTAVLSVFLVVFSAMIYSMSKVRKDNPIDALKNENL